MQKIKVLQAELAARVDEARAKSNTAPAPELRELTVAVKELQQQISDTIAEGANPCPSCGAKAHGMQHDSEATGTCFEVGCRNCGWFRVGNTAVDHSSYGAILPKHAVEAWNEGPEAWYTLATPGDIAKKFSAEQFAKLPVHK